MRKMLVGNRRSIQLQYNSKTDAGPELTLLWQRGDSLATALDRLRAIPIDPDAGRAPRDGMIPQFEGLDKYLPRYVRNELCAAVDSKAIEIRRLQLTDGIVRDEDVAEHIECRWKPSSPLRRAATAVIAYLEGRRIDSRQCHLHGQDVYKRETPYFVSFKLRYLRALPYCFNEHGGVEWIEVPHLTATRPLECLQIVPGSDLTSLQKLRFQI